MSIEILRRDIKDLLIDKIRSSNEISDILYPQYFLQNQANFRKKVMQQIAYMTLTDELKFVEKKSCVNSRRGILVNFYTMGGTNKNHADDRKIKNTPYFSVSNKLSTWLSPLGI